MSVTILPYIDENLISQMKQTGSVQEAKKTSVQAQGQAEGESFGETLNLAKKALNALEVDRIVAKAKSEGNYGVLITPEIIKDLGLSTYAAGLQKKAMEAAEAAQNTQKSDAAKAAEASAALTSAQAGTSAGATSAAGQTEAGADSASAGSSTGVREKSTVPMDEFVATEITGRKPSENVDISGVYNEGSLVCSDELNRYFKEASDIYGVDVKLLKAIACAESDFNPEDTSKSGAMGVMQLMPSTAAGLGVSDGYEPFQNILGGAKYIAGKIEMYNGDLSLALAAYNAGSGTVQKYGGVVPPIPGVQNYVKKVLAYYEE